MQTCNGIREDYGPDIKKDMPSTKQGIVDASGITTPDMINNNK